MSKRLVLFGLATVVAGCGASAGGAGDSLQGAEAMTAVVDGESWAAAIVGTGSGVAQDDVVVGNKVLEPGGYVLSFTGRQIDGDTGTAITVSFASNGAFSLGDYPIVDGALPIQA